MKRMIVLAILAGLALSGCSVSSNPAASTTAPAASASPSRTGVKAAEIAAVVEGRKEQIQTAVTAAVDRCFVEDPDAPTCATDSVAVQQASSLLASDLRALVESNGTPLPDVKVRFDAVVQAADDLSNAAAATRECTPGGGCFEAWNEVNAAAMGLDMAMSQWAG